MSERQDVFDFSQLSPGDWDRAVRLMRKRNV
jgi:hypothetical protein